jgi:hypothetical protein
MECLFPQVPPFGGRELGGESPTSGLGSLPCGVRLGGVTGPHGDVYVGIAGIEGGVSEGVGSGDLQIGP